MHNVKRFNHLGSGILVAATVLLAVVLLLPNLGVPVTWKPKTTPYRLVNDPLIGWSLVAVLCAGLALIRVGSERVQSATALAFVGVVFAIAVASGLFWDAWLAPMLVTAVLPIQRAAMSVRRTLAGA